MEDLAPHYSRFRVADRLLLTGHSHQAWPDVAFEAQQRAWLDAAELVDAKWDRAAEQATRVREGFARLLHDCPENVALGQNTHELITRWLSALPLRRRPRIVTTDGEFHTIRRQIDRLREEEGLHMVKVPARPAEGIVERLTRQVDDRTACVLVSSVLYETAEVVPGLDIVAAACRRHGAMLLVDAYHHLNVVPFDISAGLQDAFVTGGGYKYCQLGEGNCFLRVPPGSRMRPVLTGWFAELDVLDAPREVRRTPDRTNGRLEPDTADARLMPETADVTHGGRVQYGQGAAAFAGATYDPTSHYRAAAVFAFHERHALTDVELRRISRHQTGLLKGAFEALDIDGRQARLEPMPDDRRAGFLAIRSSKAHTLVTALRARGVLADARGDALRLGPAPYLRDDQLRDAVAILGELLHARG